MIHQVPKCRLLLIGLFSSCHVMQIDEKEKELKKKLDLDEERKDRSPEERALEADEYRMLFS